MRLILLILFQGIMLPVFAQGEFSANSFYAALVKISQAGNLNFEEIKGHALNSEFGEIRSEFHPKIMLPLADSGRIIIPKKGVSYTLYYFEPEKKKERITNRASDLRLAILSAFGQSLISKTITTKVKDRVYSDTYFYYPDDDAHTNRALFRTSIYPQGRNYFLTIEIRGRRDE